MKAPARSERSAGLSDNQAGRRTDVNGGCADAEAPGTVLLFGRQLVIADEKVRKTEVIDKRGTEHAGEARDALVGPGYLANPVRRIRACIGNGGAGRGSESP